jgi:hypothetical protein
MDLIRRQRKYYKPNKKGVTIMKKALFIIVLALVMEATVAPAWSAQWNYVFEGTWDLRSCP